MRAVWSFWTTPFRAHYHSTWASPVDHLFAWVISLHAAAVHYPDTLLITDSPGKHLLVNQLGLPFRAVSTELDKLAASDTSWWMLGKLVAYRLQTEPFVHVDSDVFLWKPLPAELEQATVLTQNSEQQGTDGVYAPEEVENAFRTRGGTLPVEWLWARSAWSGIRAENCGIVGGCNVGFLRYYAALAMALIESPENAAAWSEIHFRARHNVLLEQYLLAACLDYHRNHPESPYRGVQVRHLFGSWDEARDPLIAARVGYTHLIGGSKRSPNVVHRLAARVRQDFPEYFERCVRLGEI
jgi:hypothetical protein